MPEPQSDSARLRPGNPRAAATVWRWRESAGAGLAALHQARRGRLRREGALRALIGAAVGGALFYLGATLLARLAWAGAAAVLVAALASPDGTYAAIGRALALLGHGIGRGLAWILLTPVYGLFFVPFGRLWRAGRRDRLERWLDRAAPSYWHRREDPKRTKSDFEKAF